MDNKDRKKLNENQYNDEFDREDVNFDQYYNVNNENQTVNNDFSRKNKSNTKNKLIIIAGIIAIAILLFFIMNKFVFSKTSEGFPKGQLLEQKFSPNNADIMRVYGDTSNPVTSKFIRIEVESVQKKTTIYYQDSINPANVDYKWSSDSNSIIINGVNYDKTKTFVEESNESNNEKESINESILETDTETELETDMETELETDMESVESTN
nr:DUF5412 family protein [Helcococcus sueciensis]